MAKTMSEINKAARRYWAKVRIRLIDDCWTWKPPKSKAGGYGQFSIGKFVTGSHRIAWMLENQRLIPDDRFVLHQCHNPACCNPHHLYLGTHQDNMRDMRQAGRSSRNRGENHPKAKLTEIQVEKIRHLCATIVPWKIVADDYGVTPATISLIARGKSYPHAKGPIEGKHYQRVRAGFQRKEISINWLDDD